MNQSPKKLEIQSLDAIIFDFDGVLTNNKVYVSSEGQEMVQCSRSDGLAFDMFRKTHIKCFILSTEKNPVVQQRAKKLKVPCVQGSSNKKESLQKLSQDEELDLKRMLYVGNDLNDYEVMDLCAYTACPKDSHPIISEKSMFPLQTIGGEGVAREIAEDVLGLNYFDLLTAS